MMHIEAITKNWEALHQSQLRPIETEAQYLEMLEFMRQLMRQYNTNLEPHRSLWRLAAQYISHWEAKTDELASQPIQGHELLRAIADAQQLNQAQLAERLEINQGHLSRILRGERRISQKLAAKLERLFRIPIKT